MNQQEQELINAVSAKNLMEYTGKIASRVRISSLPEEVESLTYIAKTLEGFGYTTQMPRYTGYISYPVSGYITIEAPVQKAFRAVSCCFTPSTPLGGIIAETAEYTAPAHAQKILLSDGLGNLAKIRHAAENGAAAMLFVHDDNIHNCPVSDIWGNPTEEKLPTLPAIPAASITKEAGNLIRDLMKKGPVTLRLESTLVNEWRECPILIADLPSEQSEDFVLFSGHIDSWDYGAMDNGSANATMMECARLLAARRAALTRGIRLAFWSGHSQGKYAGSSWYADNHFEELEDHCIAHVNIDSVGGRNAVVVEEAPVMAQAIPLAKEIIEAQTGTSFTGKRMARNSDQSFFGIGITSVFGTFSEQDIATVGDTISFRYGDNSRAGGLGWWWHTEHDTIDKLDPVLLVRDCRIYAAVLWRLLTAPVLPFSAASALKEMKACADVLSEKLTGKFDMLPITCRINHVLELAEAFDAAVPDSTDKEAVSRYTETQKAVFRNIVRVVYHETDVFDFDQCGPLYPIPNLAVGEKLAGSLKGSSRYNLYLTKLQRGSNRVMHYLREIERLLQD